MLLKRNGVVMEQFKIIIRLRGKQVRILYDPVTVFRERGRYATGKLGRRLAQRPMSQETCLLHAMEHGFIRKSSKGLCEDQTVFRTTGNWFADGEELPLSGFSPERKPAWKHTPVSFTLLPV